MSAQKVAVVTGASSGIGFAASLHLARAGFHVFVGSRRVERLETLCARIASEGFSATPHELDVTNDASVAAFCGIVPMSCSLLVNNAGLAIGRQSIVESEVAGFQLMSVFCTPHFLTFPRSLCFSNCSVFRYDTNVLGGLRMTKALIPKLIASGDGHIINIISIAGSEVYDNGAGAAVSRFLTQNSPFSRIHEQQACPACAQ
jgi:NADP-dependent 3-hydroxy acid dehydrogenase YdfG